MTIGTITFDRGGVETVVTLGADGRWSCPADPSAADLLEVLTRADLDAYSPADGAYAARALTLAAARLGGTAWLRTPDAGPAPDVKY